MSTPIKLISLNIERSKHLDLVASLLQQRVPDVVCMQELMEYDIPYFENVCGGKCFFTSEKRHPAEGRRGIMGTGIFSRVPVLKSEDHYYLGNCDEIPDFDLTNAKTKHATETHAVAFYDVEKDRQTFRIATTHFTWTPDGAPDDFQRDDLKNLFTVLETLGEFVLCGDFNAPRMYQGAPGEIFSAIAAKYKDNVPPHYVTSLDQKLHRAAKSRPHEITDKMVDGIFSTLAYKVSDVELVSGVSDHCALVATISKTP